MLLLQIAAAKISVEGGNVHPQPREESRQVQAA
jgi:hypothetical protein